MGDNQPKKPQSIFDRIRAVMVTTLRRPVTVPKESDSLPLTIAAGSTSIASPVDASVNLHGQSSGTTAATMASLVPTTRESKKAKRSKLAKFKKNDKYAQKDCRDRSEETSPAEESAASDEQRIDNPDGLLYAATLAAQEDTHATSMSVTAESDNYSSARSTQSTLYSRRTTSRTTCRQKQTNQWGNTPKGYHGSTHEQGNVISSPVEHNHNMVPGKSTSKQQSCMQNVDSSVNGRTEENIGRPGTSNSALVKIFLSNPITETDCDSIPIYLELPKPSTLKTPTYRVTTVRTNDESTSVETRASNKTLRIGTKHEHSTKTPKKENKKCASTKGHTSSRGTTAHGSPQSKTLRRSTKQLLQSKKTDTPVQLPSANKIIFRQMVAPVRFIPESKQRDSAACPKRTIYQPPDKSNTQEQSFGNSLESSKPMTWPNNQDLGVDENNAPSRCQQVRPQTCYSSRDTRTQDRAPPKQDNAVLSMDQSRTFVSNICNSQQPLACYGSKDSRRQDTAPSKQDRAVLSKDHSRAFVSNMWSSQHQPQTCSDSNDLRTQDAAPSKQDNAVLLKDHSRAFVSNKWNSELQPQTSQSSRNSRMQIVLPTDRSRSNASNGCSTQRRSQAARCSSNAKTYTTAKSKLNNASLPKDATSIGQSRSNNVTDKSKSQLRLGADRCSSNSRTYLVFQTKLNKTISPTNRSRSNKSDRHNSQLQPKTSRANINSRVYLNKTISPTNQSTISISDRYSSQLQPETSRASRYSRKYLASQPRLHETISLIDISVCNNVSDGCVSKPTPRISRHSSISSEYLAPQSKLNTTFSPTTVGRPFPTPRKVLNKSQFESDLKSDSTVMRNTISNILPPGINKQQSSRRVANNIEKWPFSSTIAMLSDYCWFNNGQQSQHTSLRETQDNSSFQSLDWPSTHKQCSSTEVNARPELSPPNIGPATSFPNTKGDKITRTTQDTKPSRNIKITTVPLIREKTYLILPSVKVSGNDDANKALLVQSNRPLLTRENTFLILQPVENGGPPISKRKSLNKVSTSTPVIKRKKSRTQLSKIASDNIVTNTSSGIPLAKGNTYLIMAGPSASSEETQQDNYIIPLMKKSTYLIMPSKKHSSEIKINKGCDQIPIIRSSTYEIIKSKKKFSVP